MTGGTLRLCTRVFFKYTDVLKRHVARWLGFPSLRRRGEPISLSWIKPIPFSQKNFPGYLKLNNNTYNRTYRSWSTGNHDLKIKDLYILLIKLFGSHWILICKKKGPSNLASNTAMAGSVEEAFESWCESEACLFRKRLQPEDLAGCFWAAVWIPWEYGMDGSERFWSFQGASVGPIDMSNFFLRMKVACNLATVLGHQMSRYVTIVVSCSIATQETRW